MNYLPQLQVNITPRRITDINKDSITAPEIQYSPHTRSGPVQKRSMHQRICLSPPRSFIYININNTCVHYI